MAETPGQRESIRRSRLMTLHTLAQMAHEGMDLDWHEYMPGDGSGVQRGRHRLTVEMDVIAFSQMFARLSKERGWEGLPDRAPRS